MKPEASLGTRLFHNTFFNLLGRFWIIGVNLLLTPLILSYLGQDRFAIWALFWAITQYFALLDLGMGPSLLKHFAQFHAKRDMASINQTLATVCYCYVLAGVLLLLLWPAAGWLASSLSLPAGLALEAETAFHTGLIILVLMYLLSPFDALLKGLQRMDMTNLTMMAMAAVNWLGTYVVLKQGGGLSELMAMTAGIYLVQGTVLVVLAKRALPGLSAAPSYFCFPMVRRMLGFGSQLQVSRLAEMVSYQADKILLGFLAPIRYVTFYDLGAKLATAVHDLPLVLLGAVLPAASQLAEQRDDRRLWLLYERGTKYLMLVSLPILAGIWLTTDLVLTIWLGHVSSDVRQAVLVLATGYCISINTGMVTTVGIGLGWLTPIMRAGLLQCGLNLALSFALILWLGYPGALIGTLTALIASNTYLLLRFYRDFDRPLRHYLSVLWKVLQLNAAPALLAFLCLRWLSERAIVAGRMGAFLSLLVCVAVYVTAYVVAIRWSDVLDRQDWEFVGGCLPGMRWLALRGQ